MNNDEEIALLTQHAARVTRRKWRHRRKRILDVTEKIVFIPLQLMLALTLVAYVMACYFGSISDQPVLTLIACALAVCFSVSVLGLFVFFTVACCTRS